MVAPRQSAKAARLKDNGSDRLCTRSYLKRSTAELHTSAEHSLSAHAPIESPTGLSHFLRCMLVAHKQFKCEYDAASRFAMIEQRSDSIIKTLHVDLSEAETLSTQTQTQTQTHDIDYSMGVAYVFEGSSMGATILKKRIAAAGGTPPGYLNLLTADSQSRWKRFITALENCNDQNLALRGATETFNFVIAEAGRAV